MLEGSVYAIVALQINITCELLLLLLLSLLLLLLLLFCLMVTQKSS